MITDGRKANYAVHVNIILPLSRRGHVVRNLRKVYECGMIHHKLRRNWVDTGDSVGIILLTVEPPLEGDAHGRASRQQDQGLAEAWIAERQGRPGARSPLPGQRVLRSTRPGAGQVRDAAPGAGRGLLGHGGGQCFSRVAFYQAMAAFQEEGLPGLLPRRRGPKEAHKLTGEVLVFIDQLRATDSTLRAPQLAAMVLEHLGLSVHPRSIERALTRRAKRGRRIESS